MSDSDLNILVVFVFFGVLWVAFNALYYTGEMQQKDFEAYNNTQNGAITDIVRPSFLDFLLFESDIAIVNQLLFIPFGAIIVFIGARYIRGI